MRLKKERNFIHSQHNFNTSALTDENGNSTDFRNGTVDNIKHIIFNDSSIIQNITAENMVGNMISNFS